MKKDDDKTYNITAKGFFCFELMEHDIPIEQAMEIWNAFQAFVARRAKEDGCEKGFPSLIFDGKGGACIKIPKDKQ